MNLLEHIVDHLDFLGLGAANTDSQPGNLFWGQMPDQPDRALSVLSVNSSGYAQDGIRIQIFTRGPVGDARVPYEWACALDEAIGCFAGFLHGDGPYVRLETLSCAEGCGMDTRGRHLYVSQYRLYRC